MKIDELLKEIKDRAERTATTPQEIQELAADYQIDVPRLVEALKYALNTIPYVGVGNWTEEELKTQVSKLLQGAKDG